MELGVGFATDGGVHGQIGWTKPWINSRGHSLRSNLYLSAPKQTLEATYRMPLLKNPLNYYYDFAVGWEGKKRTIPIRECLRCQRYVIGIMRMVGNILADFVRDTTVLHKRISLIKPYFFIQLLDLLVLDYVVVPLPLGAMCKKITFDLSKRIWLSESSFIKVQASSAWVRTYAENHRIVARAEIGYLHTKGIEKIPPTLRFFAGGDRSVRGYGYKKNCA